MLTIVVLLRDLRASSASRCGRLPLLTHQAVTGCLARCGCRARHDGGGDAQPRRCSRAGVVGARQRRAVDVLVSLLDRERRRRRRPRSYRQHRAHPACRGPRAARRHPGRPDVARACPAPGDVGLALGQPLGQSCCCRSLRSSIAVAVVEGVLGLVLRPATMALLPAIARSPEELVAGNVVTSTGEAAGTLVGPAVGGALLALAGPLLGSPAPPSGSSRPPSSSRWWGVPDLLRAG